MSILDRALRVGEGKKFKAFERNVELINAFEPELELESDEELRERYEALRERYLDGERLDDLLYESLALTRARRSPPRFRSSSTPSRRATRTGTPPRAAASTWSR